MKMERTSQRLFVGFCLTLAARPSGPLSMEVSRYPVPLARPAMRTWCAWHVTPRITLPLGMKRRSSFLPHHSNFHQFMIRSLPGLDYLARSADREFLSSTGREASDRFCHAFPTPPIERLKDTVTRCAGPRPEHAAVAIPNQQAYSGQGDLTEATSRLWVGAQGSKAFVTAALQ